MDDVDVKIREDHHSNADDSARCCIFRNNKNKFGKEFPRDDRKGYSWHGLDNDTEFSLDLRNLEGRWIGFKGITINEGSESTL